VRALLGGMTRRCRSRGIARADLEVYNPLMGRRVRDWAVRVPDRFRANRQLHYEAMRQAFPALADLPYATVANVPDWDERFRRDPRFARFYADVCSAPGWLDGHANKPAVIAAWWAMERGAAGLGPATSADLGDARPALARRLAERWKEPAKRTPPGRLLRDALRERRLAATVPLYLKLARLATLHAFLGQIESRRTKRAGARTARAPLGSRLPLHEPSGRALVIPAVRVRPARKAAACCVHRHRPPDRVCRQRPLRQPARYGAST